MSYKNQKQPRLKESQSRTTGQTLRSRPKSNKGTRQTLIGNHFSQAVETVGMANRKKCPAADTRWYTCHKVGHLPTICRSAPVHVVTQFDSCSTFVEGIITTPALDSVCEAFTSDLLAAHDTFASDSRWHINLKIKHWPGALTRECKNLWCQDLFTRSHMGQCQNQTENLLEQEMFPWWLL